MRARTDRRRGTAVVVALGAAAVAVAALAALDRGSGRGPPPVPQPTPSATAAPSDPTVPAGPVPVAALPALAVAWEELPGDGVVVVDRGVVTLLALDGTVLARGRGASLPGDSFEAVPDGTDGVALRPAASRQPGIGQTPPTSAPDGSTVGRGQWRQVLASPDGRWLLAQWSHECQVPAAYLLRADGRGRPEPVLAGLGEDRGDAPAAAALGWTSGGRAVVAVRENGCGRPASAHGVYLVDPGTGAAERVFAIDGITAGAGWWRRASLP